MLSSAGVSHAESVGIAIGENPNELVAEKVVTATDVCRDSLLVHFSASVDIFLETSTNVLLGPASFDLILVVEFYLRYEQTRKSSRFLLTGILVTGRSAAGEHSACPYGVMMATPGLKIIAPTTPYDAKGLTKSAIREDNPVQVFYHVGLILNRETGQVPEEEYTIPIGVADIKREGSDVTVVAIGIMVQRALAAAAQLQEKGINIEIVDPRALAPLDKQTIINSVKKTGRLVIMD